MWRKLLLIEINAIFLCILSVYSSPRVKKSAFYSHLFCDRKFWREAKEAATDSIEFPPFKTNLGLNVIRS